MDKLIERLKKEHESLTASRTSARRQEKELLQGAERYRIDIEATTRQILEIERAVEVLTAHERGDLIDRRGGAVTINAVDAAGNKRCTRCSKFTCKCPPFPPAKDD